MYSAFDTGAAGLNSRTAEYLRKGSWPTLRKLRVGDNKLGSKGIKVLSKGNWPLL